MPPQNRELVMAVDGVPMPVPAPAMPVDRAAPEEVVEMIGGRSLDVVVVRGHQLFAGSTASWLVWGF